MSILDDDFETIWVEIKNKRSQNILCCCSYRHPNTEIEQFNKYIDKVMTKITEENKLIFCMGDFNVNLLNYNTHNYTNEFMNNMISHYLLPRILHPTRVTDHSATVIDNIFSNNTSHETVSGNIMALISDHFPQFIILIRQILTTRDVLFPNVISQNLMNKSLLIVLQETIWTSLLIESCHLIKSLIYFTKTFHHVLSIKHPQKK